MPLSYDRNNWKVPQVGSEWMLEHDNDGSEITRRGQLAGDETAHFYKTECNDNNCKESQTLYKRQFSMLLIVDSIAIFSYTAASALFAGSTRI